MIVLAEKRIDLTKDYTVSGKDLALLELAIDDMRQNPTLYREVNVMHAFKVLIDHMVIQ